MGGGWGVPETQSSPRRAITADPTWDQTLQLSLNLPTSETSARFSLGPRSPRSYLDHAGALPGTLSMRSECSGQPGGSAQDVEPWVTERDRCPAKQPPPPATSFVPIARRRTKSPRPRAASATRTRQRRSPIHPARPFPLPACSAHPCSPCRGPQSGATSQQQPRRPGSARAPAGSGGGALARRQSLTSWGPGAQAPPWLGAGRSRAAN